MAYHVRKQIREKIKQYLENITILNGSVFFDNPDVVQPDQFPCVYITSLSEQVNYPTVGSGTRVQERVYTIEIISFVKSNKNLTDKLDEIEYEIEKALASSREVVKLDGLVMYNNLVSTEYEFSDDPDLNIASTRKTYEVHYRTIENLVDSSN